MGRGVAVCNSSVSAQAKWKEDLMVLTARTEVKKRLLKYKITPDAGISSKLLTFTCAKQLSPSWALICLKHWIHCLSPYEAFQVSFLHCSGTDTRVYSARRGLKSLLE